MVSSNPHLGFPKGVFPSEFCDQNIAAFLVSPQKPSHASWYEHRNNISTHFPHNSDHKNTQSVFFVWDEKISFDAHTKMSVKDVLYTPVLIFSFLDRKID
jgi:hypothetical protein